mmetsp:Transcript_20438/g.30241  ORF Transcript_20438/g.30241 Transcript_20438/m.30241 type:complete len:541 (+) Transcript_20438:59-1681(+)
MADVSNWVFGDESEFLVGPIVGRVTETSARILIESAKDCTAEFTVVSVKSEASVEGETQGDECEKRNPSTVKFDLTAQAPKAVEISDLTPGHRVEVSIRLGSQTRVASFNTPSPNAKSRKVGLVSCNKISTMVEIAMWEKMAENAAKYDVVLHMGDQIYGDDDFKTDGKSEEEISAMGDPADSAWGRCQILLTAEGAGHDFEPHRAQCIQYYADVYRTTWNHPPCASALAGVSNLMMLDDHEITDDAGDVPEHCDRSTWQYFVIGCAYQAYNIYQGQLNYSMEDPFDFEQKAYWYSEIFPGVGLFMLDVRLERCLLRHQIENMDWENHNYLGPRQFDEFKSVLEGSFKDIKTLIMVSPTPPIFLSSAAASLIELKSDDVVGSWSYKTFKKEHKELLQTLTDWQNGRSDRAVIMASGDIHIGGFSDVQLDSGGPLINQVISSAIGNLPEASVKALKAIGNTALAVAGVHLTMRINHSAWVFDPNYAVLTIEPPSMDSLDKERPSIKGEIITKEYITTHDMKYTIPGGVCGEAMHGCQCTTS